MATHSPQSGVVANRVNEIDNAVKTQIWIAISIYVLVAIVKRRLNLDNIGTVVFTNTSFKSL